MLFKKVEQVFKPVQAKKHKSSVGFQTCVHKLKVAQVSELASN